MLVNWLGLKQTIKFSDQLLSYYVICIGDIYHLFESIIKFIPKNYINFEV